MIEQFFQIGENWIDKEEYLFQLIDAIAYSYVLWYAYCIYSYSPFTLKGNRLINTLRL